MRVRSAGFTLIEVLVALAIVAIGMAAVLESLTASANTVLYLKDKTLAEWVGLNQIANTRLQLQPGQVPMTGNTTGDVDYAGRSWHWRQEVTPTQVAGIVRIDVKVRPADVKAGDDNGWFSTVSGIAGDALAAAQGTTPTWGTGGMGEPCQPGMTQNCNPQCPQGTPAGTAGGTAGCNTNTPANQPQPCPAGTICPSQTPTNPTNQSPIAPAPSGGLGGGDSGLGGGSDDFGGGIGGNSGGLGGNDSNSGGLGGNGSNSGGLGSDSH